MQFTDSADIPMDMEAHAPYYLPRVDEDVEIRDNVAIINVPAPRFGAGDPAYILHDFKRVICAARLKSVEGMWQLMFCCV